MVQVLLVSAELARGALTEPTPAESLRERHHEVLRDLELPEGVSVRTDVDLAVASVVAPVDVVSRYAV